MLKVVGCITMAHDLRLVALAGVVCFAVSLLAYILFANAIKDRGARPFWLAASAIAGGSGFWATHFIAMLSYRPGLPVGYDPAMVLVAWIVAVLATGLSFAGLRLARSWAARFAGGCAFGLAGAAIHYVGLRAFHTMGRIEVDPAYVVVSIVAAMLIAGASAAHVRNLKPWRNRVLGAAGLTLSICSLHFIGMAALRIVPDPGMALPADLITPAVLSTSVVSRLILTVVMAVLAVLINRRTDQAALFRLKEVFETMPAAVAYFDADDRAVMWNSRFSERSGGGITITDGRPYEDLVRGSLAARLYPDAVGREEEWLGRHLSERRGDFETRTVEIKRADRWVQFAERRTQEGGHISIATDITDLKRNAEVLSEALARAEAAGQVKTDFLSNLSHELRTPLNGVLGLSDALASSDLTAPQRRVVEGILASAHTLADHISSILDFSQLQAGGVELACDAFDPAQMVRDAGELFASAALAKGLSLDVLVKSRPGVRVMGDAARVKQVLLSLLSNAVKFTEAGAVRISLEDENGVDGCRLRFAVADTGIGFDGAQADRLFTHFEQGDGSMTRKFGGTGLGLAISRQIADLIGAELTANSLPGHGATFTLSVTLPWADAAWGPQAAPQAALEPSVLPEATEPEPLRVLLADDHPTNRQVVELILGATESRLTSVENGAEALEAFQQRRYDLVLMDLQMPVMDGLTAMKAIRAFEQESHLPRTPMIALTANVLAEHVAASLAAGADRHVGKPITAQRLLEEIGRVFAIESAANDVPDAA